VAEVKIARSADKDRGSPLDARILTDVPKTIADCFKYRHKIGLDVAIEALRESWESRRYSMDELWSYAKICRMSKVMRPYLECL
jgi:hypothetical protein